MANPRFWIERAMLHSPAYLDLGFSARATLFHFYARCQYEKVGGRKSKEFRLSNNGQILFTYKEAQAIGYHPLTFRRVLLELQEHGFIEVAMRGFGGVGQFKASSQYSLSEKWRGWMKSKQVKRLESKSMDGND